MPTPESWMKRYAVESKESDSYDDYDPDLFLVCLECRERELKGRTPAFFHVGSVMVRELGCLGPWISTSQLGLMEITEMVMNHEIEAHSS